MVRIQYIFQTFLIILLHYSISKSTLFQTPVTEENVVEVSEELAHLTQPAEKLSSNGVASTADILQNITALNSTEPAVNSVQFSSVQLYWSFKNKKNNKFGVNRRNESIYYITGFQQT